MFFISPSFGYPHLWTSLFCLLGKGDCLSLKAPVMVPAVHSVKVTVQDWGRYISPKPDDRINKYQMTEYSWPDNWTIWPNLPEDRITSICNIHLSYTHDELLCYCAIWNKGLIIVLFNFWSYGKEISSTKYEILEKLVKFMTWILEMRKSCN